MTDFNETLAKLKHENPETDFLVISRGIDRALHYDLTKCLDERVKKNKKCHLFLTTYGGDPHGGYRVARCLRHHYSDYLKVIVPSYCKSAGTMIAIAADQLAIGDLGELGPLDVQVIKPNETQERGSGLDIMTALTACLGHAQDVFHHNFVNMRARLRLSAKQAGELAAQISAGMLAPLYGQIEPLRIGELQRALSITLEYGARLNTHTNNLRVDALMKLVRGYPAHGFVIDRKEAKDLFNSVVPLSHHEYDLCTMLWKDLGDQSSTGPYMLSIQGVSHDQQKQGEGASTVDIQQSRQSFSTGAKLPRRNPERANPKGA